MLNGLFRPALPFAFFCGTSRSLAASCILLSGMVLSVSPSPLRAEELILDTIVASVDGDPITLSDLAARLRRPISLKEAGRDSDAKESLDAMITERVLNEEAKQRGLTVRTEEIEQYISEIAQKNNLSVPEFFEALSSTGATPSEYRQRVEMEILKSKVTASALSGGIPVSDEEIDTYIKEHEEEFATGSSLKLSQILLSKENYSRKEARSLLEKIASNVSDKKDFSKAAQKYSDAPEATEGGSLGVVAERDLNPSIFNAVFSLEEGETSDTVSSPIGYHLFFVEQRMDEKNEMTKAMREQVRVLLQKKQMEVRLATFLSEDLMDAHAVERKM